MHACEFIISAILGRAEWRRGKDLFFHLRSNRFILTKGGHWNTFIFQCLLGEDVQATLRTIRFSVYVLKS